jgi:predicted esterase YcpF (UPF0227 family)
MIVYLHGFNSAFNPDSDKVRALSKIDEVYPVSYNSFDSHTNILYDLLTKTRHLSNPVFVGTSLGGFYAAALASSFGSPCVLINPVVSGLFFKTAGEAIKDVPMKNYVTGEYSTLTQTVLDSYATLALTECYYEYKPLLLLDMGDELLDSYETRETLKDVVSPSSLYYPGGSHRFDHIDIALPSIQSYLNNCSYVSHLD